MVALALQALSAPDRELAERLFLEYYSAMYHVAGKILKSDALAHEAVQEAFVRILKIYKLLTN